MKLQAVLSSFILTFCLRNSVYVSFIITGAFFGELSNSQSSISQIHSVEILPAKFKNRPSSYSCFSLL
ncbi:hypothetical protein Bca4012_082040 [Brassica carinata]